MSSSRSGFLLPVLILMTLLTVLALLATSSAATDVSSDVTTPTTWDPIGSPYIIRTNVVVQDGVTLTIAAGVEVMFDVGFYLECQGTGRIVVTGTKANNTIFGSNSPNPVIGDWPHLSTGVGGIFNNATISQGTIGLYAETGSKVIDCTIQACTTGIILRGTGAYIQGATLWATNVGVAAMDATNGIVIDSSADNVQEGFNMLGTTSATIYQGCTVNNSIDLGFGHVATGSGNQIIDGYVSGTKIGILIQDMVSPTAEGGLQVINCTLIECTERGIYLNNVAPTQEILIKKIRVRDSNNALEALTSGNFQVTECTFRFNNKGTRLQDCTAGTIVFHRNNFIKNNEDAITVNSQASYDKNGYGNFWWRAIYEYGFTDMDGDGIADTAWSLTGSQKDNFPLMVPVDFDNPSANAGPDITIRQRRSFDLDGKASTDDTWIANYTWAIGLPSGDEYYYGEKPSVKILEAGVFTVTLRVTDPLGNIDYDDLSINVTDADAPVIVEMLTPTRIGAGWTLVFSAQITDNIDVIEAWVIYKFGLAGQSTRLDLVNEGNETWSAEVEIPSGLGQKVYYSLSAKDQKNNLARTGEKEIFVDDLDPPVLVLEDQYNITTGDTVWLNATITDNRQVASASVEYWFGDEEHVTASMSRMGIRWIVEVDVPREGPSPMKVIFNATDVAGNSMISEVMQLEVIDNDAPVLNLDSSTIKFHKDESAEIRAMLSDNFEIATAYVEVKYPPETIYESTILFFDADTGFFGADIIVSRVGVRIYYHFKVIDTSGNELVTEDVERLMLSQRPSITTDPATEAWEEQLYSIELEAEDPDSLPYEHLWSMDTNATWLDVDQVENKWILYGTPHDYHVGWYWVNLTVEDSDRVADWLYFEIVVHDVNSPPSVTISFPLSEQKVGSVLKVSGRAEDDQNVIEWVKVSIDDGEWVDATGTLVWSYETPVKGFDSGLHWVTVKAYDGESESIIAEISFVVPKKDDDESPGFGGIVAAVAIASALVAVSFIVRRRD